jgi:phage terminase large subunit GpA-like protein
MFRKRVGNGMTVTIVNALSASALAQRPVRYLIFEEVSRLPLEARGRAVEGDVISLAKIRTSTFGKDAKIVYSSSPIERELCRVTALYEASTRERYHSRCPRGHLQILLLAQMNFKTAGCKCLKCNREYRQEDWQERVGKWIAEDPLIARRGFWMNIWPSPFVEWQVVYEEWRAAIALKRQGDWSLYRSVCGCRLAEAMKKDKETTLTSAQKLMSRREIYPEKLPDKIKVLVAACDTMDTWLEFLILAFGPNRECWALETGQIFGRADLSGEQMYKEFFERVVNRHWLREDGKMMGITRLLQDCGGHLASIVCRTLKLHWPRLMPYRAMAIGESIFRKGEEKSEQRCNIMIGNSSLVKDSVNGLLAIEQPGAGFCHFPINADGTDACGFSKEFFEQLAESERRELVIERGLRHWRWKQIRDRNEALDNFVMCLVGLETLKLALTEEMPPIVMVGAPGSSQAAESEARRSDGTHQRQRPRFVYGGV